MDFTFIQISQETKQKKKCKPYFKGLPGAAQSSLLENTSFLLVRVLGFLFFTLHTLLSNISPDMEFSMQVFGNCRINVQFNLILNADLGLILK